MVLNLLKILATSISKNYWRFKGFMKILDEIKKYKIVPVVAIDKVEDTVPLMNALVNGGLPVAEITFRTACAKEAIKLAIERFPNALIGAGTVINEEQALTAIDLGCKFIVSPGYSHEVAMLCKEKDVLYLPGVVTPTEIMMAIKDGLKVVKFFPASNFGGLKTIKALGGPFPQIEFLPTGGINETNILEFLDYKKIVACGGSFMMKGTFEEIEKKTKEAVALVNGGK